MMLRTVIPALAIGFAILGVRAATAAESLIRAAIVDEQIYVSPLTRGDSSEPSWKELGNHFTLLGKPLARKSSSITLKHHRVVDTHSFTIVPHRWQIDRQRVHSIYYAPSIGSPVEPFFRHNNIGSCPLKLFESLETPVASKQEDVLRRQEFSRAETWEVAPDLLRKLSWRESQTRTVSAFFDFLPTADERYEWYVSEPDGQRERITRSDLQIRVKPEDRAKWAEVAIWTADFSGPFFVAASGDDRYFVTDEGHVYSAPRVAQPPKMGTPLKEVWTGKPPVDALIHDVDNAKWYAFTKDHYFEVTDPLKPIAHAVTVRRAKTANEALETAVKCGRVVRHLPEPKSK